jgi:prepilin-type processing-associated H-X9-DG protein
VGIGAGGLGNTPNNPPGGSPGFFSSDHAAVTNFVFLDGSVHSISNNVSPITFAALCTSEGNEPTPGNYDY